MKPILSGYDALYHNVKPDTSIDSNDMDEERTMDMLDAAAKLLDYLQDTETGLRAELDIKIK